METHYQKPSKAAVWLAWAGVIFVLVPFLFMVIAEKQSLLFHGNLGPLFLTNFPTLVGLPVSAVGAFIVVTFLRQAAGPIDFEGFGFKFHGAAGQVILWIMCFLAFATTIKLTWHSPC